MTNHHPHHHHHIGHAHPPALVHASILRLSMLQRLAATGAAVALIWAAALWAMR